MKAIKISLALVILVVLFIFSINNSQTVQVVFLQYETPAVPLFLIILFVFVLGLLLGLLFSTFKMSRLRREVGQARKSLAALQGDQARQDVRPSPPPSEAPPSEN